MPNVGGRYQKEEDGKVTRTRAPTASQVRKSRKKTDPEPVPSKPTKTDITPKPKPTKSSGKSQG